MGNYILISVLVLSVSLNVHFYLKEAEGSVASPGQYACLGELPPEEVVALGSSFFLQLMARLMVNSKNELPAVMASKLGLEHPIIPFIGQVGVAAMSVDRNSPTLTEDIIARLKLHGAVCVPYLIPLDLCRTTIIKLKEIYASNMTTFQSIRESTFRRDHLLSFSHDEPLEVLFQVVQHIKGSIEQVLGTGDVVLSEFGSLVTFPGAKKQPHHADENQNNIGTPGFWATQYTMFVYLDDVRSDQGAFDVWPGTHQSFHWMADVGLQEYLVNKTNDYALRPPPVRFAVPAGSAMVYDQRTYHRGAENTYAPRPSLYFSFMPRNLPRLKKKGYHMRDEYFDKVTLDDLLNRRSAKIKKLTLTDTHKEDARQDLEMCLGYMQEGCFLSEPASCFECGIKLFYGKDRECKREWYLEYICKTGIYAKEFEPWT